jgi:hypothetical protein
MPSLNKIRVESQAASQIEALIPGTQPGTSGGVEVATQRITANAKRIRTANGGETIQIENVTPKRSLTDRAVKVLRATEAGEALGGVGALVGGIVSLVRGDVGTGLPLIAGGATAVFDFLKTKIVDWMKS